MQWGLQTEPDESWRRARERDLGPDKIDVEEGGREEQAELLPCVRRHRALVACAEDEDAHLGLVQVRLFRLGRAGLAV